MLRRSYTALYPPFYKHANVMITTPSYIERTMIPQANAYETDVLPGALRYVIREINDDGLKHGIELVLTRPTAGCSRCLSAYVLGQNAGTIIVENTVNSDNAAWRAITLLGAP